MRQYSIREIIPLIIPRQSSRGVKKMPALFQWVPADIFSQEQLHQRELKMIQAERLS
jgi:hypothetical protein